MSVVGKPGPGWWMASDRQWYPPELHPDVIGRWWEQAPVAPQPSVAAAVAVLERPVDTIVHRDIDPTFEPVAVLDTFDRLDAHSAQTFEEIIARFDTPVRLAPRPDVLIPEVNWDTIDLRLPYPHGSEALTTVDPTRTLPTRPHPLPAPPAPGRLRRLLGRAPVATGALAAVGTAAVAIAALHGYAQVVGQPETSGSAPTLGLVSVFDLKSGMCLSTTLSGAVDQLTAVSCADSHTHRVAATVLVGAASSEFDAEQVQVLGSEGCRNELAAQGLIHEPFLMLQPSEQSWGEGDRQVVCLADEAP